MRRFQGGFTWSTLALLSLLVCMPSASYCGEGAGEERAFADLQARWEARRNAIASISIRARLFRKGESGVRPLAPKEVAALARQYKAASDPTSGVRSLIEGLRNESLRNEPHWAEITFATDRERTAEDSAYRFVRDGRADVVADLPGAQDRQAKVYDVGRSRYGQLTLDAFAIELRRMAAPQLRMVGREAGLLVLAGGSGAGALRYEVEEESAIVRRYAQMVDGRPVKEVFQLGVLQCAEGVVIPEVVVEIAYTGGRLSEVSVLAPTVVVVNEDLGEDAFRVSMPKDSVIIDLRQGAGGSFKVSEDVRDVVDYLPERVKVPEVDHPTGALPRFLAGGSVLVFLVLVVFLLVKRRKEAVSRR